MEKKVIKLIISADDFGINHSANQRMLKLAEEGKIARLAVIVNGFISPSEAERIKATAVKIDIHLTLPDGIRKNHGLFLRLWRFVTKYVLSRRMRGCVENEWQSQILKFQEIFGKIPDGLNAHEHVQFYPPFLRIAANLCSKFQIRYLRYGRAMSGGSVKIVPVILNFMRRLGKFPQLSDRIDTPDNIISIDWINNPKSMFTGLPPGVTEFICHPENENDYALVIKGF